MRWLLLPLLAVLLGGCAAPAYYAQAIGGHFELMWAARPVAEALADPAVPERVRRQLAASARLREFASRELGLPDNGSYRKYADLGRPYVVWNVFAAAPWSLELTRWCFPVAGCVAYRGYFSAAAAGEYAAELRAAGDDVFVGGVPAYSTLGWFDDPLLNTFILYPEAELARLMFHELAHQVVYVRDDSLFNESFAVAVEEAGLTRWVDAQGSAAQRQALAAAQQRRSDFHALIKTARSRLARVYAGPAAPADKLAQKAQVLTQLRDEYRALRDGPWGGFAGYERLFGGEINNATLASVGLYLDCVPAFRALLAENGDDLPRFYAAVRALAVLVPEARAARLGCPA